MRSLHPAPFLGGFLAVACATSDAGPSEGFTTLLGEPLPDVQLDPAVRATQQSRLAEAEVRRAADPKSEDAWVWVGRRLAYLGRYQEALDAYTHGLALLPDSVRLLRHRGHRWITVRQLDRAVEDLERASALLKPGALHTEQDGLPNARGIPLSTTEGNVHYHLGLAHYLRGDFEAALTAFERRAQETDRNDDNRCATAYWRYLCYSRTGRPDEARAALAAIAPDVEVIENGAYRDLVLLFRGDLDERQVLARHGILTGGGRATGVPGATLGYGLAMHAALGSGDQEELSRRCRAILADPAGRFAFGAIAAEAELARALRPR